jgi:hypothetical protein
MIHYRQQLSTISHTQLALLQPCEIKHKDLKSFVILGYIKA